MPRRNYWIAVLIMLFILPLYGQVNLDEASRRRASIENLPPQVGYVIHVEGPANTVLVFVNSKPLTREFLNNIFSDEQFARNFWMSGFRSIRMEAPGQQPWTRFLRAKGFSETDDQTDAEKAVQRRYVFCSMFAGVFKSKGMLCGLGGENSDVITITYPDASNEFARDFGTAGLGKQLSEYGFTTLYITNSKDGHWGAKVLPTGFGKLDDSVTSSTQNQNSPQPATPAPDGSIQQREALANGSTSMSKLTGKNFVYSVCGDAKDVLCVVDPNPNVGEYARSLTFDNEMNKRIAGAWAKAGFTSVSISDGKGSTWLLRISEGGLRMVTPAHADAAPQKKVIQDQTEYNAYLAAVNATDPAQKSQMMENYLQTYPNSLMKEDGLELLLKTYQQLNNGAQIKVVGQRLLQVAPNNLTALALLSYLDRAQAQSGGTDATASLQEAGQLGVRGLLAMQTAAKPEGYTDDQWNSMRNSFRLIYMGSVGHAALQAKDYPTAQQNLKEVVEAQPTDVNSIYLLALAYLSPAPPIVDGLFWIAKAAGSAPQLVPYAKNQYVRYHGGDAGFDELMAAAKSYQTVPVGFTVAPAP
jgi:hypothetical protein